MTFHKDRLAELPAGVLDTVVAAFQNHHNEKTLQEIRDRWESDPETWWALYHFGWGMSVRNFFRSYVVDQELPSGNWDDYYIPVIEVAVGVRARPE